jgi:acyl transferase domain-containing protein
MLALEHDMLSINYREPYPEIPFADLNLEVCAPRRRLPRQNACAMPWGEHVSAVGGKPTNAHVVISDPLARLLAGRLLGRHG